MIPEIIFVFILTFILVALLVPLGRYRTYHSEAYRRRMGDPEQEAASEGIGVGLTMLFFFFLLFPLILAGNLWIGPYGPVFMDVSWLQILIIGILLALLIAALSPREPKPGTAEVTDPEEPVATGVAALFGLMFYILFFAAIAVIIVALIR